ncbi:hypothetical protein LCGC14_2296620, partial [marine sediment metagenome]
MNVYVNHGRWVVDCPTEYCGGASIAETVFVCDNCKRVTKVVWPDNRTDIDRVLNVRPVPQTRNWIPGETVDDLERENVSYGL